MVSVPGHAAPALAAIWRMVRRARVIGISLIAWFFVLNGRDLPDLYVASGEWRRRVFHPQPRYLERD